MSRRVEHLSIAIADLYDVVNRKAEAVIKLIMTISGVAATGEPRPLLWLRTDLELPQSTSKLSITCLYAILRCGSLSW